MKTNKAGTFQLNKNVTNMTEKQQLLNGLYHQDLQPSAQEKAIISNILNWNYDQVDKLFSSNKGSNKSLGDQTKLKQEKIQQMTYNI